ncbi:MAG: SDR family oxidoreductase [Treponema sp.]|jgi:NAD(P)-dependent dehydrogenase (short-subunit alcohol dehydrogenase family)|nr:SDR family oxidoreductase [Treponema sp.]
METVFITGLSREMGLGTALARQYLRKGYTVFASCRDVNKDHINQLKTEWKDSLIPVALDVTSRESVENAATVIRKHGGLIDILISNATATNKEGNEPIDAGCDTEHMLNAYNVNAVGFLRMVQVFLPFFSKGAKVNAITSEAGSMGHCWRDNGLDYGMAKAALNFACVTLQRRLGKNGIRVLAIHPGWVQTRPAPPKADLTPEQSAEYIIKTIANPPDYNEKGNTGVFVWYDGRNFVF